MELHFTLNMSKNLEKEIYSVKISQPIVKMWLLNLE